jgi:para-nitrobenzyl esterase
VDGWVVPSDPADLIGTSRQASIPVLIGYAADEGDFFLPGAPGTLVEAKAFVAAKFGEGAVESVIKRYGPTVHADAARMVATFFGDYELLTSTVLTARAMARRGPVRLFQFSRVGPPSRRLHAATHTSEIPYVFGNLSRVSPDAEPLDHSVSDAMAAAWVTFAKTADPNGAGLPAWPLYERPAYRYLNYGDTISIQSGYRESQIEFAERLLRGRHAGAPR